MARKTTWKEFHIVSDHDFHVLKSYHQSSRGAWEKYTIWYESGMGFIETNLPWSEIRRWFSYSFTKMPGDVLTAEHPSWYYYCTCGKGDSAPDTHANNCESYAEVG